MADTKITALAALTGANVATGDDLVIVDVSDTTMAASGTDKKITAAELADAMVRLLGIGSVVPLAPIITFDSSQGTWAYATGTGVILSGTNVQNSSAAQNDFLTWDVFLAAGTWKLDIVYLKVTNGGILNVDIGGTNTGSLDMYNGSTTGDNIGTITGITIATSGLTTVKLESTTKNASSTGYRMIIVRATLRRTA